MVTTVLQYVFQMYNKHSHSDGLFTWIAINLKIHILPFVHFL